MLDKFPVLKGTLNSSKSDNPADEWDFFMTSACAGIILLTNEEYDGEHESVENRLNELDINYMRAVADLMKFMEKGSDDLNERIATLGYWILWNVKKDKPTDDELQQLSLPIWQLHNDSRSQHQTRENRTGAGISNSLILLRSKVLISCQKVRRSLTNAHQFSLNLYNFLI